MYDEQKFRKFSQKLKKVKKNIWNQSNMNKNQ